MVNFLDDMEQNFQHLLCYVCDLRFADDVMASSHTSEGLQEFITRFSNAARSWGLCVSTDKTKVLVQNTSDLPLPSRPVFHIDNNLLETVPNFCYLGSTISSVTNLDQEISRVLLKLTLSSAVSNGVCGTTQTFQYEPNLPCMKPLSSQPCYMVLKHGLQRLATYTALTPSIWLASVRH